MQKDDKNITVVVAVASAHKKSKRMFATEREKKAQNEKRQHKKKIEINALARASCILMDWRESSGETVLIEREAKKKKKKHQTKKRKRTRKKYRMS